jgi:predicted esterase
MDILNNIPHKIYIDDDKLHDKYGKISLIYINPQYTKHIVVIPGYSDDSFYDMLKIIINDISSFGETCIVMVWWGSTVKKLSKDVTIGVDDQDKQYQLNEDFRTEMGHILYKIIRSKNINLTNFNLMGKSAGGGIAIIICGMHNVSKLFLCCPATINGCKPLDKKDTHVFLSWNQDDPMIPVKKAFDFMDDMNKQHNLYRYYSYLSGGHELNPLFLQDITEYL